MKYAAYLATALVAATAAFAQAPATVDRQAATEKDYRATLSRVGIQQIRPGAVDAAGQAPPERTGTPLPPLLIDAAGRPVDSRGAWERRRRELTAQLDSEIYGSVPATAPGIRWQLVHQEYRRIGGVPAVTRRFVGRAASFGLDSPYFAIELSIDMPEAGRGRLPVILEIGDAEAAAGPGGAGREAVLRRGWGFAVLIAPTVQPDDGAGLRQGVIGFSAQGRARGNGDWGTLRAWAWGASRAYDLFLLDPRIDRRRVAVEGSARYGKTALLALATDERFSLGFAGSSGPGGAAPLRREIGERIGNLAAANTYHWFAPNFLRYAGPRQPSELPVDAHSLIALVAPRALFIGAGSFSEDGWTDPRGAWDAARAASPVWRLYGQEGLAGEAYPAINEARDSGRIAFRQHDGGRSNDRNWPAFLSFAARIWELDPAR